jgi:type I restriction enzyme, S subunit
MKPDVFFKNFELLADAPNGVQKLRELILQLAVMGKLVPQDPNDEPASVLIEKIKAEKKKLGQKEKNKGSKLISSRDTDQVPSEIPSNWEWTTLSRCGLINPRNDISGEKEVSFIPMTYISEKYGQNVEMEIRKWEEVKKGFTHFAENDVVLAKITPCFQNGKSTIMKGLKNGIGAGTTELHVFRPLNEFISSNYVLIYLKSPDFLYNGIQKMTGSAGQKRVPKDYFSENPFPLPPLAEQKRIVSKVDELMSLCDKLEARRQKKQKLQSKLNSAALDRMLSAENQEEFEQHWQRICENFDFLYDNPENVEKLKQAILQLAVQGKLMPQNSEDEPASVLIERIEMEKGNCVKKRDVGKFQSAYRNDSEDEKKSPNGWENLVLGSCIELISGQHLGKDEQNDNGLGLPYLTGPADFGPLYPTATRWTEKPKALSKKDDILITVKGAGVGKTNILGMNKAAIGRQLMAIRPICLDNKFVYLLILASYDKFQELSIGLTVPGISRNDILDFQFGLPPLAEQKRIVERVEQLMGLCDELETKLRKERENSEKLMEAVVKGLLEGAATEKPELEEPIPLQAAAIQLK